MASRADYLQGLPSKRPGSKDLYMARRAVAPAVTGKLTTASERSGNRFAEPPA
jgi:hypothetical protein